MSVPSRCPDRALALGAFALALAFGTPSALAQPGCSLVAEGPPASPLLQYDVFAFERAVGSTEVVLRNTGEATCDVTLTLTDLAEAPPPFPVGGTGLFLEAIAPDLQTPQRDRIVPGVFRLDLPAGDVRPVRLDLFTDQALSVPAGTYRQDLELTVRAQGEAEAPDRLLLPVVITSDARAQVNIAGTDGTYGSSAYSDVVDFGQPEVGETRRLFLQLRANAPASLRIRSQNAGAMRHESVAGASIGYELRLDGSPIDLSAPATIGGYDVTTLDGLSAPLDLTITGLTLPLAGRYGDTLIVEISPN